MYRKDGMDYGPFPTSEIHEMIRDRVIWTKTEVHNQNSKAWKLLGEVPSFREFVDELVRRETEKKKRDQIERSVSRVERTMSAQNRIPYIIGFLLVVSVGLGAYLTLQPGKIVKADLSFDIFGELSFDRLPMIKATLAAPEKKTTAPKRRKRRPAPSNRVHGTAGAIVNDRQVAGIVPEVDLSFDSGEVAGGRELSRTDLDSIQKRVTPRLIRCFRNEATRRPDFNGGAVLLYVLNSGRVILSRLNTDPAPSPDLESCAMASVKGIAIEPFAGANQVMEIPLHVASVR